LFPSQNLKCPKTLFFNSRLNINKFKENNNIKTINLNQRNKQYFVTFYINHKSYYSHILKSYNLKGSRFMNFSHNLFLNSFNRYNYKKRSTNIIISKYQKIYEYIIVDDFYMKSKLYQNYKFMKKLFNNDFNYMCETFTFPKDKRKIKKDLKIIYSV